MKSLNNKINKFVTERMDTTNTPLIEGSLSSYKNMVLLSVI